MPPKSTYWRDRYADQIILLGVLAGNAGWILDIAYSSNVYWGSSVLRALSIIFQVVHPLFYLVVMYIKVWLYPINDKYTSRGELLQLSLPYVLLQQFKVLGAARVFNEVVAEKFASEEHDFDFVSLENCFEVQTYAEFGLQAFPQLIFQATNNETAGWNFFNTICVLVNLLIATKSLALILVYQMNKNMEGSTFRPKSYTELHGHRLEMKSVGAMTKMLSGPASKALERDGAGNTALHNLVKSDCDADEIVELADREPHLLFVLNKKGQTPLDIIIEEEVGTFDEISGNE